jgi:hypothetical protein
MIGSTEHAEQCGFVTWFRARYPDVLIFAVPNGGKRTIGVAKKMKDEGVVSGIPDLFVPQWKLWIEMKRERGGVVSQAQWRIIDALTQSGYAVIIGKGARDASAKVIEFAKRNKYEHDI